jgi:hypothetical protein
MDKTLQVEFNRDTKNTRVYREAGKAADDKAAHVIYFQKSFLGANAADKLTLTIKAG